MIAERQRPLVAHVAPFAAWIGIMMLPGIPPVWNYAARTVFVGALLVVLRPWQGYPPGRPRTWPGAAAWGVLVTVVWVLPETAWFQANAPGLARLYERSILGGRATGPAFAPAVGGWGAVAVRVLGSALVVAVMEEFFWRGFAYRYLQNPVFMGVKPAMAIVPFVAVAVIFGFEHTRWLVGIVAGLVYGWLYVKTGDIWSVAIAHGVTNALLAWYIVATGHYGFW